MDTRRRFSQASTFETGQHSGVASSANPQERQPQQEQPEHMQVEQGQEWETQVQISHAPMDKNF